MAKAELRTPHLTTTASLPPELEHIAEAVKASRSMLDLKENWDDDNARQITPSTWERAAQLTHIYASAMWRNLGIKPTSPEIVPVPDGSIDIDWRLPGKELLINVSAEEDKPLTYYGDDGSGGNVIKGEQVTLEVDGQLRQWLPRHSTFVAVTT